MEGLLKRHLSLKEVKVLGGAASGGCINNGQSYDTDRGKIFVKYNEKSEAKVMFEGESASLSAILNTDTVTVPRPHKVFPNEEGKGWIFAMEHLNISQLRHMKSLGEQLARLHLHNSSLKSSDSSEFVSKFGFPCMTCCGFIAMPNDWKEDWMDFFIENRLQIQLGMIQKEYNDDKLKELWPKLRSKIPHFFEGIVVEPALLHGDLWSGNMGEDENGPVIFDPASFYGHHEFDLAITTMFGGFSQDFYNAYHRIIPKAPRFHLRQDLYLLFHYLNHWNHFGTGYRAQSISIMNKLIHS